MMLAPVLLLLGVTPVSLKVDLSRDTSARLGTRVREQIEARLGEEGFAIDSGAKLKLGVEELHGVLHLSARVGGHETQSELRLSDDWPAELGFEVAQRLAVLAHEAEGLVAEPEPAPIPKAPLPAPDAEPVEPPAPAPAPEARLRLGASVRAGVLVRYPSIDPEFFFQGSLPTDLVEPVLAMGLVYAPGPGLTAWEVPLLAGVRVPIALGAWWLTPDLLLGGRVHFHGPTSFDAAGVRLDFLATAGASLLRAVGSVRLGVRLGLEVSPGREHLEGGDVLWSRAGFGASAMLIVER